MFCLERGGNTWKVIGPLNCISSNQICSCASRPHGGPLCAVVLNETLTKPVQSKAKPSEGLIPIKKPPSKQQFTPHPNQNNIISIPNKYSYGGFSRLYSSSCWSLRLWPWFTAAVTPSAASLMPLIAVSSHSGLPL